MKTLKDVYQQRFEEAAQLARDLVPFIGGEETWKVEADADRRRVEIVGEEFAFGVDCDTDHQGDARFFFRVLWPMREGNRVTPRNALNGPDGAAWGRRRSDLISVTAKKTPKQIARDVNGILIQKNFVLWQTCRDYAEKSLAAREEQRDKAREMANVAGEYGEKKNSERTGFLRFSAYAGDFGGVWGEVVPSVSGEGVVTALVELKDVPESAVRALLEELARLNAEA